MSANTPNEGYPYPLTSDFADVQDAFRLATAIDTDLRAEQAPFRAFEGRPSFIGRQTVTGSGLGNGDQNLNVGVREWDNTGGLALGLSGWQQPFAEAPSWWLFGATVLVSVVSGTPIVGDLNMAELDVTSVDAVTNVSTTTRFYQRNDDTATNGEWINVHAMAAVYHGSVSCALTVNRTSGTSTRSVQLGSRLWGMYLGPVT